MRYSVNIVITGFMVQYIKIENLSLFDFLCNKRLCEVDNNNNNMYLMMSCN